MEDHLKFLAFWFLNSLTICLFGFLFPWSVVLGNFRLTPIESSIYAGFWLTFFAWTIWAYFVVRKVDLDVFPLRLLFMFFVNSLGVWLIAHYSQYSGLGTTSFGWALVIGIAATALQNAVWGLLNKSRE